MALGKAKRVWQLGRQFEQSVMVKRRLFMAAADHERRRADDVSNEARVDQPSRGLDARA